MDVTDIRTLAANLLAGIAPDADIARVGESEDLREAHDLDPMDFLNFIIGLSQGSATNITESDYPKLFTLAGIHRYLSGHDASA